MGKRGIGMKETKENATLLSLSEDCRLNLSDFALFLSVMKVKEAYEDVLGIILDEPDLTLKEVKVEQVVLNKSGKRAIRLDAWALDEKDRQFDMEMQNVSDKKEIRRRARYYQGMIDTPVLKSGKETRYRYLPSTVIIFITQEDIFGRDLAKYTFSEQCEELGDLPLEDGTKKIFLNMASKNGRPELISLLQYMKNTTLNNPEIIVRDERIVDLDRIVGEVKQSEEWEAVKMNILEIGLEAGRKEGLRIGREEGIEKGREEGIEKGINEGIKKGKMEGIKAMIQDNLEEGVSEKRIVEKLQRHFSLDLQVAENYVAEFSVESTSNSSCQRAFR